MSVDLLQAISGLCSVVMVQCRAVKDYPDVANDARETAQQTIDIITGMPVNASNMSTLRRLNTLVLEMKDRVGGLAGDTVKDRKKWNPLMQFFYASKQNFNLSPAENCKKIKHLCSELRENVEMLTQAAALDDKKNQP